MEIKDFAAKVRNAVKKELGEAYEVELKEVEKNNGIVLHGLLILTKENNVIPTIYLESFWEAYELGTPFAVILSRILTVYHEDTPKSRINLDFFQKFDKVKDRICYRLIGRKGNEILLKDIPYIDFLDLAICFFYAYQGNVLGEGSILIHNSHMEIWGISTAELLRQAQNNTPKLFPWEYNSMDEVLREAGFGFGYEDEISAEEEVDLFRKLPMKVLSNRKRTHGAACILYPGILEKLAAREQRGFYILPSSIHEVIILAETGGEKPKELKKMITEINSDLVAPEEVLSDNLYYYDLAEKRIRIIF